MILYTISNINISIPRYIKKKENVTDKRKIDNINRCIGPYAGNNKDYEIKVINIKLTEIIQSN
jgi:hypothetical protein